MFSSLEPEIQKILKENETQSTALARADIVNAALNYRKEYKIQEEADSMFLDLYNSGMYMQKIFKYIGTISTDTLYRWIKQYKKY